LVMGQLVAQIMGDDKNITTTMILGTSHPL
jgi:hypothetical protein